MPMGEEKTPQLPPETTPPPATPPATEQTPPAGTTAGATAPTATPPPRKWGGQFETPEDLERTFYQQQGALAAMNRMPAPAAPAGADPNAKFSDAELRHYKETNLAMAVDPNVDQAERQKAVRQLRLIDEELQKRTVAQAQSAAQAATAQ